MSVTVETAVGSCRGGADPLAAAGTHRRRDGSRLCWYCDLRAE